jgi:hypothetical protein
MKRLEALRGLPTMMGIAQEIALIHDLMAMPADDIAANRAAFRNAVRDLEESHTGGAYFELTKDNEGVFFEFADWLDNINKQAGLGLVPLLIESFRISCDDLVRAYAHLSPKKEGA